MTQSNNLFDALSCVQGFQSINFTFFEACHQLCEALRSFADYLIKAMERSTSSRNSTQESMRESILPPIESVLPTHLKEDYLQTRQDNGKQRAL